MIENAFYGTTVDSNSTRSGLPRGRMYNRIYATGGVPFRERSWYSTGISPSPQPSPGGRRRTKKPCRTPGPLMRGYWLYEYFPEAMRKSIEQMPALDQVSESLLRAGLGSIETARYEVPDDLQDLFLCGGKHRPQLYLVFGQSGIVS